MSMLLHSDLRSSVEPRGRISFNLRGASLSGIVWNRSMLLEKDRAPNELPYTSDVQQLDVFLSHSWSASGPEKHLSVVMSFYVLFATKIMVLSTLAMTSLTLACSPRWCLDTFIVAFSFTGLLCVLIVAPLLHRRRLIAFLDKCCITEADPIGGVHGISMLSEYVRRSDKLIILWSSDYVDRLWCIYELAVFLETHSIEDVVTVHMKHMLICCVMLTCDFAYIFMSNTLVCLVLLWGEDLYPLRAVRFLMWLVMVVSTAEGAYRVGDEAQEFYQSLKNVDSDQAKCSDRGDEVALKKKIVDSYGSLKNFDAVLRGIWMRPESDNDLPPWLVSETALRVLSLPYILLSCSAIVRILAQQVLYLNEISLSTYPAGVLHDVPIAVVKSLGAMLLLSLVCCRTSLLMVIGSKLASSKGSFLHYVRRCCLVIVSFFVFYNSEELNSLLFDCQMPSQLLISDGGPSGSLQWAFTLSLSLLSTIIVQQTFTSDLPANLR
ncbi:hypothetical protein FOL47_003739 [Perkinsus chesapeaki]|uniref:Uncharacterized protein n=1 Tax=Perkinsus chesapeaki TaxID=330153 RepID=A0A7J6M692_PERCH|nr:hypothetical protein FOL47_003739 [Perkinsus chesapeaki]